MYTNLMPQKYALNFTGCLKVADWVGVLIRGKHPNDDDWETVADDTNDAVRQLLIAKNWNRRQLTQSQRAMIVARSELSGSSSKKTKEEFKFLGTSKESVERGKRVWRSENWDVIQKVRTGVLSVSKADLIISGRAPAIHEPVHQKTADPNQKNAVLDEQLEDQVPEAGTLEESGSTGPGRSRKKKKPKKAGRPSGNAHVVVWMRGWGELAKAIAHISAIKVFWRPTRKELGEIEETIKLVRGVLKAIKKPKAA